MAAKSNSRARTKRMWVALWPEAMGPWNMTGVSFAKLGDAKRYKADSRRVKLIPVEVPLGREKKGKK